MARYDFLTDTYRTERLKTLGVWAQVPVSRWHDRPEPRGRHAHEHFVHQCLSEDGWMRTMLGIDVGVSALPAEEARDTLIRHYADVSAARVRELSVKPDDWFEAETAFFDVTRSRAWVLTRRIAHTAHHRGQLTALLRAWGLPLYSTYGPTADTGGLPRQGARVVYPDPLVDDVLGRPRDTAPRPFVVPSAPVTERP